MKKILSVFVIGIFLLTGCKDTPKKYAPINDSGITVVSSIDFKTEFSEYDQSLKMLTYTITNNSEEITTDGDSFELHKFDENSSEWMYVSHDKEHWFLSPARIIDPSESYTNTIDLEEMYDLPLPVGRYRLQKSVGLEGEVIRCEFTVK